MKKIIPITRLRLPELVIPEGYSIILASGSSKDRRDWKRIISTFRSRPYPNLWDKVWFAYKDNEAVGLNTLVLPPNSNTCIMDTCVVLPEHRRKGLHNAMTYYRIKYAKGSDKRYIKIVSIDYLDNWWRKLIF